jgi:hypothetical protein
VPRRALLKEWAYAGAFFTYTGAIVSHLTTGYDLGEVGLLAVLTALTALSWALRPRAAAHDAGRPPHRWPPRSQTPGRRAHTIRRPGTGPWRSWPRITPPSRASSKNRTKVGNTL